MVGLKKPGAFRHSGGAIVKLDESLGIVFGWLIVTKVRDALDEPFVEYQDVQKDTIEDDGMLEAAADFMLNSRTTKAMHAGDPRGTAVFAFPLTEEIAKAYGIESLKCGLLFAAKPDAESLAKFRSGEYTGFSIGGHHIERVEVTS